MHDGASWSIDEPVDSHTERTPRYLSVSLVGTTIGHVIVFIQEAGLHVPESFTSPQPDYFTLLIRWSKDLRVVKLMQLLQLV